MDGIIDYPRSHAGSAGRVFIAADVGGTHARVALLCAPSAGSSELEVLAYRTFTCADYPSLSDLLRDFIDAEVKVPVQHCVLACAGQVMDDAVVNDNLAWRVRLPRLRHALALERVDVLNDFEALGYALDAGRELESRLLCGPDICRPGPTVVVGPGTGLGAAVRLPCAGSGLVLTTECGQMDLAPTTAREREVLAHLAPEGGYVAYERILSGPGLLALYRALCALQGVRPLLATPESITAAARACSDACAIEAVNLFCATLGSFAGSVAMAFMADGGVYLAGGFLSSMFDLLQQSRFVERFLHQRSVRKFLERVPVRVMEHGRHGVLGAARWYLQQLVPAEPATQRVAALGAA